MSAPITFVTAAICFVSEGQVLTVRKRNTWRFQLPGGKIEPGETPLAAAVRETVEEIGVVVDPADLTELGSFTAEAANEPGAFVEATVYVGRLGDGVPAPLAEIAELRWTPITDRPADLAPLLAGHILPALERR